MFRWEDIIYSNGEIRKERVERARVVWLGLPCPAPVGMMWQPGAIIPNLAIFLEVTHLTRSPSFEKDVMTQQRMTIHPKVSEVVAR